MQRCFLAVLAAGVRIGRRPVVVVDGERRHVPGALLLHLRDLRVGELQAVLERVAATVQRALQAGAVVGVAGDVPLPAVRLVDDRLQLLDGQRRLRDEIAVAVEPRAVRHVDLEPVGAVRQLLAGGLARLDGTVDELGAARHADLGRVAFEVVAAGRRDRQRRHVQARPGDVAALDRLLDADVAVARTLGLDVAQRREALRECAPGGHRRPRGAKGQRILQELDVVAAKCRILTLQEDVGVGVDESGQHGLARQVDDPRAGRYRRRAVRTDRRDAIARDDDQLTVLHPTAADQPAGTDHLDLGRGGWRLGERTPADQDQSQSQSQQSSAQRNHRLILGGWHWRSALAMNLGR